MTPANDKTNVKLIFALTLIHFTGDFYVSFITPLLPVFTDKFALTLAEVGLLTGLARVLGFVVQPPVGYLADHYRTRFFVLGGPLLAMVSICLTGIAPSFGVLLVLVAAGSVGSSMFHPPSAAMVSTFAGRHFGLCMSIFNMGGTLSFGIGPLFITWLVAAHGLGAMPYSLLVGLPAMAFLVAVVPAPEAEGFKDLGLVGSLREAFGDCWKPVAIVWVIMTLRAFVSQSFLTYLPIWAAREGHSLASVGIIVACYTIAGALSGVVAGHLSDRIGYKPIFYAAHLLAVPSIYLLLLVPGKWVYLNTFLTGFFLLATLPVGLALAQRIAPKGKSMVSSLMMGFSWGVGGMLTPVTGSLADAYGIRPVLLAVALVSLATMVLVRFLYEPRNGRA